MLLHYTIRERLYTVVPLFIRDTPGRSGLPTSPSGSIVKPVHGGVVGLGPCRDSTAASTGSCSWPQADAASDSVSYILIHSFAIAHLTCHCMSV